ncbi:hypothetical protein Tco_1189830, partial [Tanacetum coccineum]
EKVHQEKTQQDKLKEVKARLNFEGCSRRSLKIQEVSQHSKSRTPNIRGEHGRRRRPGRSRSTSRSPKPTPNVFSKIRCDGSESSGHRDFERKAVFTRTSKGKRKAATKVPIQEKRPESVTTNKRLHRERKRSRKVKIAEEDTRSQVTPNPNDTGTPKGKRRAVTKVSVQEKRNPFPESVTTKERLHREWKRSRKVKIVEEDIGSQYRKNKSQIPTMGVRRNGSL